jgi:hypothetical protein
MWITQLVVHHDHRGKGHASALLRFLIESGKPVVVGVASSHPHAVLALKKSSKAIFDEDFIRNNLRQIITLFKIPYLVDKPLIGSLFQQTSDDGPRLQIDTGFYTDHTEPLEALSKLPADVNWPLGQLLDGHEFVVVFSVESNRVKN